jgi:YVTN family beta-propeller protein
MAWRLTVKAPGSMPQVAALIAYLSLMRLIIPLITTVGVGMGPTGVALTPDGSKAFVPNSSSNNISVVNTANNTLLATVPAGIRPSTFGMFVGERSGASAPPFSINQGIAGAWFNPMIAGQGFLIDIEPQAKMIFLAWFTYVRTTGVTSKIGAPEQRWLTAQGVYDGGFASLPVFSTRGGAFGSPTPTTTTQVGTLNLSFANCTSGTVSYSLSDPAISGTIQIQRLLPAADALCRATQ